MSEGSQHLVSGPNVPDYPNIVFLFTDDQRFDAAGGLGDEQVSTPNMDRLIKQGVTLTQAYIMGSTMPAVCCPSRAQVMSGQTVFRAPDDLAGVGTLPETLCEAGYTTFGTGKWHNRRSSFARCFQDGANIFFGGMSNHLEVPVYDYDPSGEYPADKEYIGESFSSKLLDLRSDSR